MNILKQDLEKVSETGSASRLIYYWCNCLILYYLWGNGFLVTQHASIIYFSVVQPLDHFPGWYVFRFSISFKHLNDICGL